MQPDIVGPYLGIEAIDRHGAAVRRNRRLDKNARRADCAEQFSTAVKPGKLLVRASAAGKVGQHAVLRNGKIPWPSQACAIQLFGDWKRIPGDLGAAGMKGLSHQRPFTQEEKEPGRSISDNRAGRYQTPPVFRIQVSDGGRGLFPVRTYSQIQEVAAVRQEPRIAVRILSERLLECGQLSRVAAGFRDTIKRAGNAGAKDDDAGLAPGATASRG